MPKYQVLQSQDQPGFRLSSRNLLASAIAMALLPAFGAYAQDKPAAATPPAAQQAAPAQAAPQGDATTLDTVVVTGIRRSIETSLENKRDSNQIVDAITAEDVGKLPDPSVADVLQRVPGVQVSQSMGESGLIVIRGLQSNRTEVDGRASFGWITDSSNGFNEQIGRNFGANSLSSSLVRKVEVFKTPMATQVEGGLGGVINSHMYRGSDFSKPTFLIAGRGSTGSKEKSIGQEWSVFAGGKVGDRLGLFLGAVYSNEPFYLKGPSRGSWNEATGAFSPAIDQNGDGKRDIRPTSIRSENFTDVERERFGVHGNLEFEITPQLKLRADTTYTKFDTTRWIDAASFGVPASGAITNPVFDGNYVVAGTVNSGFTATANPRAETVGTRTSAVSLEWADERGELKAEIANTTGVFKQTNINLGTATRQGMRMTFDYRGDFPSVTLDNPAYIADIANYGVAGGSGANSVAHGQVDTEESSLRLDGALWINDSWLTALRVGLRASTLEQERNGWAKAFGPVGTTPGNLINIGPATNFNGPAANYPDIFRLVNQFNYPGFPSAFVLPKQSVVAAESPTLFTDKPLIENTPQYYNTQEDTLSGYVQADFETDKVRGNFGVRVVRTTTDTGAFLFSTSGAVTTKEPVNFERTYTDILPSGNITFKLQDDLLLRLAASRTMARQALDQAGLAPNMIVSINRNDPSLSTVQSGNPFLDPTISDNFDTSLEWYFAKSAFLAGTVFYKKISGFPVRLTERVVVPGLEDLGPINFLRPVNADSGTIQGLEVSYQQTFDFLPGWLSGLGVIGSFAVVDAHADISFGVGTNVLKLRDMPMTGVSDTAYSLTGFYEKGGFNTRLSYTYRSDRLFALQSPGTFDATSSGIRRQYVQGSGKLDASVSYRVNKNLSLYLNAANLLPEKSAPVYYTEEEQFYWRRDIGESRYSVGFRYKF